MWIRLSRCSDMCKESRLCRINRWEQMMWPSEPIYTSCAARPILHTPHITFFLPASHGRSQHAEPAEIGPHIYEEGLTA